MLKNIINDIQIFYNNLIGINNQAELAFDL